MFYNQYNAYTALFNFTKMMVNFRILHSDREGKFPAYSLVHKVKLRNSTVWLTTPTSKPNQYTSLLAFGAGQFNINTYQNFILTLKLKCYQ